MLCVSCSNSIYRIDVCFGRMPHYGENLNHNKLSYNLTWATEWNRKIKGIIKSHHQHEASIAERWSVVSHCYLVPTRQILNPIIDNCNRLRNCRDWMTNCFFREWREKFKRTTIWPFQKQLPSQLLKFRRNITCMHEDAIVYFVLNLTDCISSRCNHTY